jgi:hypothetical protein
MAVGGCSVALEEAADAPTSSPTATPVAAGCRPFSSGTEKVSLGGPGRSLQAAGDQWLWIFDSLSTDTTHVDTPAALVGAGAPADCFAGVDFMGGPMPFAALDASALGSGRFVTPLDGASVGGTSLLYFAAYELDEGAPFGVRAIGYGIATLDPESGRYLAEPDLLWTADRPSFGTSVVVQEGWIYAYGCRTGSDLVATCFVARVDETRPAFSGDYTYSVGGGQWSSSPDDAMPTVIAGPTIGVRYETALRRYIMSDVPALGRDIELRTGLGPAGPWSERVVVATCDVPDDDSDAFCSGAVQHPEVASGSRIALTYSIQSLSPDASGRVAANPERYGPRLVILDRPTSLP